MQSALYLTATRGYSAPEARACYERAETFCHSLHRPLPLYSALMGQWRYSLMTGTLIATMHIAQRVYVLAQGQNEPALQIGAYRALAMTHYYWAISKPREGTRAEARSSGARVTDPLQLKRSLRRPSLVSVIKPCLSGTLEKPLAAELPWPEHFHSRGS
jgi:hypothetical protein